MIAVVVPGICPNLVADKMSLSLIFHSDSMHLN